MLDSSDQVSPIEGYVSYFSKQGASRIKAIEDALRRAEISRASSDRELEAVAQKVRSYHRVNEKLRRKLSKCRMRQIRARARQENLEIELQSMLRQYGQGKRDEYRRICAIPRVRSASVEGDHLIILTEELFGKDRIGGWHRVGIEKIEIDMRSKRWSDIRWTNLTGIVNNMQGPPNISAAGTVGCFGNALPPIEDAFAREDWPTLVAIVVRYPECSGARDCISKWPVVDREDVPKWYLEAFGDGSLDPNPESDYEYEQGRW